MSRWILVACVVAAWCRVALAAEPSGRLEMLRRLVHDESPAVRVEALRALAKIPTAESAELALSVLEKPMDPTLDYALWLTVNDLAEPWIAAVQSGAWSPAGRERQLEFALKALKPEQVGRVLASVLGTEPLAADGSGPWIEVLGTAGSPEALGRLLDQAVSGGFQEPALVRALKALADAARLRNARPSGDTGRIAGLLSHGSVPVRIEAIRLAGLWKQGGGVVPVLLASAGTADLSDPERTAVFEALRLIGGDVVVSGLLDLTGTVRPPEVRRAAAVVLASLDATRGFPAAVDAGATLTDEASALEYWRGVLAGKGSGVPLREALTGRSLPEVAARAGMRVAREGGRDDVELATAFAVAGRLSADPQQVSAELIRELAARAAERGDPERGEFVYRRSELACVTCHAIGGVGGKVGPDMTSLGASAPMDYLVESLLLPSAKIKEGYHAVVVETKDGEEITGTLARETPEEIVLRNAAGEEVSVSKASVARREMGRLSLMPSGLLEPLSEGERLDLVAFLSRLGKPGVFDASRGGVARKWRVANLVHTDVQNEQGDWYWSRDFGDRRWTPVEALVRGDVTRAVLETAVKAEAWSSKLAVLLATEVEVPAAGVVQLKVAAPGGEVWVAGRRLGAEGALRADLPAGRHRLVLKLDPRRIPEVVRVEAVGAGFVLQ